MEAAPPSSFHFRSNPFSAMPVHWAQQSLFTRLVLVAGTPGHNLYSCLLAHIKAAFLLSLTETPSVVAAMAASTCGSRQETDALAQHSSASLTCPCAFLQLAHVIDTFCSAGDMTWCRGGSRDISQKRESSCFCELMRVRKCPWLKICGVVLCHHKAGSKFFSTFNRALLKYTDRGLCYLNIRPQKLCEVISMNLFFSQDRRLCLSLQIENYLFPSRWNQVQSSSNVSGSQPQSVDCLIKQIIIWISVTLRSTCVADYNSCCTIRFN